MFHLSLRKLAAFRVGLGLVLLFDLADRASAFRLHFTGDGVYPTQSGYPWVSLLSLSDSALFQASFFAVAISSALALTVGYRTRIATAVAWVCLYSIQSYAHVSHFSADDVARLLLFWGIWLPLGAKWSIDSRRSERAEVMAPAAAAIFAQVAVISFAAGLHKIFDPTWGEGWGVELALRAHGTALGLALTQLPPLTRALDFLTVALQVAGSVMLFVSPRLRTVGAVSLLGFQMALALCMDLSFFPFVTMVGLMLFLPDSLFGERGAKWERSLRALAVACAVGILIPALSLKKSEAITDFVRFLGLGQSWSMFAPPPTHLPWIVVKLQTADGKEIDAATRETFAGWETAREVRVPAGIRWATLAFRLGEASELAPRIGHAICRAWQADVPDVPMRESEVYLVVKDLRAREPSIEPHLLAQAPCKLR